MAGATLAQKRVTWQDFAGIMECPRCRAPIAGGDAEGWLSCRAGHRYEVRDGVPRLVEPAWGTDDAGLVSATSAAFGHQWVTLGDGAAVAAADLQLHLPAGWGLSVFQGQVLDAGCGMGRYTAQVAALGAVAAGLDLSEAVDKAAECWPEAPFFQADIVAPPFRHGSFDVVYSFGVLHHLPDPLRGFRSCFNLVKPGGLLLVWVYSGHGGALRRGRRWGRRLVARAPALLTPLAASAAAALWLGYLLPRRRLRRTGDSGGKLSFYDDKGPRQLYVDCHDALSAPSEVYLGAEDCRRWLAAIAATESGFERRSDGSGWIIWARR